MRCPVLLCVDDSLQLLQVRRGNLERLGYFVMTATSVRSAIAALEKMAVDAVVIDYKQEGMDAEAVAFQIKQRFPQQPIILLSAYLEMPERILWLVDEYLMRSEGPERLAQVIEDVTRARNKRLPSPASNTQRHAKTA